MNNAALLKQARDGVIANINVSPVVIIIQRMPLINDGFGGEVPDPFGTITESSYKVRISHERKGPASFDLVDAGLSTNLSRFIFTDYRADIREGDIFEAIGKNFKIGSVDPLYKYNGIVGYQAPLTEAAEALDDPIPETS